MGSSFLFVRRFERKADDSYVGAFDRGVMSYHSVKMAEINASIGYLWNRTYQGTG